MASIYDKPRTRIPDRTDAVLKGMKRDQNCVQRKIVRRFDLDEYSLMDEERQGKMERAIPGFEASLKNRIEKIARDTRTKITPEQSEKLIELCTSLAPRFYRTFYLRDALLKAGEMIGGDRTKALENFVEAKRIHDIYAIHLLEETLVRIKAIGLRDESAFSLAGCLIHNIMEDTGKIVGMEPQKPLEGLAGRLYTQELQDWRHRVLNYTVEMRDALNASHRESIGR